MTTLRVIVDQILAPAPSGVSRYAEEITRELIRTAPRGVDVAGVVSASPAADYDRLETLLPGMSGLFKSALARRELSLAWQHGFTRLPGGGMLHSPSQLAPLYKRDRLNSPGDQTVVTVHDVVAWTHPETLTSRGVAWHKAMAKRAQKYADAIVAPTHFVAEHLAGLMDFGDRIRVIGGAVSSRLAIPADAEARATALELPERFLVAIGTLEPRKGLRHLIAALADPRLADLPLLVVGPSGWGGVEVADIAAESGLSADRVRTLGQLPDAALALVLQRAEVFVLPTIAEGFGLSMLEAMSLGTPVVHSDAPAVTEVAADAGIAVPIDDLDGYPGRLADSIAAVLEDSALAERMSFSGIDRAAAFSWRDSAQKVWQLHADL